MWIVPVNGPAFEWTGLRQDRHQTSPINPVRNIALFSLIHRSQISNGVNCFFRFILQAEDFQKGREKIHADYRLAANTVGFGYSGPPHNQGYPYAAFVQICFAAAQGSLLGGPFQSTVIGEKDNYCFVGNFQLIQFTKQSAYTIIQLFNHRCNYRIVLRQIGTGFVFIFINQLLLSQNRTVNSIVRNIEKEGFVLVLFQKLQ